MKKLIVAPHPDDEILGAGGTFLRYQQEGHSTAWLIVTAVSTSHNWSNEKIHARDCEIEKINQMLGFEQKFELRFPSTQLDQVPMDDLVSAISNVFKQFEPEEIFIPHPSDIHTDHRVVFDAVASCTKWFRYPSVKRVLAYETLSETDFNLGISPAFRPNVFVNIENHLDEKLRAMEIYKSEMGEFPFPRSQEAIKALAMIRGAASGYKAAEAFELLRERI